MKALLVIVVVLLVGIAGFGFYQGWFRVSTEGTEQQPSATITVDKDKIRADETSAKEKVFGPSEAEETGTPAEEVEP
jgi:cytoskeletal protein RodZ